MPCRGRESTGELLTYYLGITRLLRRLAVFGTVAVMLEKATYVVARSAEQQTDVTHVGPAVVMMMRSFSPDVEMIPKFFRQ